MKLGEDILKILNKIYEPSSMIDTCYKNYDMAFKTDSEGRPVLLFLEKKDGRGNVKGERFARRLKINTDGSVSKDHWEHKGKAT